MSSKYICARCNRFETNTFSEIKKHLLRKNQCRIQSDVTLLSNDQLFVLTLMSHYNGEHCVKISEVDHLENSNLISQNKVELFNELEHIIKNTVKVCKYCNDNFTSVHTLRKHVILKCFHNELVNRNNTAKLNNITNNTTNNNNCSTNNNCNTNNNYSTNDNSHNNNCNNTTNNNITNNNNSNYNIFFNLPVPFEDDWDISQIPKVNKNDIMVSQYMFSSFLAEILKNDKNSNVIIDKNDESGMVYLNHKNQYVNMTKKDIILSTMDKLYDQLYDMVENNTDSLKVVKECSKDYIHNKYNKYIKDKETNDNINDVMLDTYHTNKDTANKKYIDISKMNKLNTTEQVETKSVNKKERINRNKSEFISSKTTIDNIINARNEDIYYLYDSDGNTKA